MTARLLLLTAIAGATGAICRYGLTAVVQRLTGGVFPWGTFAVNTLGCLIFGYVWTAGERALALGPEVRAVVLVGFVGSFTTFSTFAFETGQMARSLGWAPAAMNLVLSNVAGIAAVMLGSVVASRG